MPIIGIGSGNVHPIFWFGQGMGGWRIRLCQSKQSSRRGQALTMQPRPNDTKLSLSILESSSSDKVEITWQDDDDDKLESRMTDITIKIVLTAEVRHRESAIRNHQWRIERKAQLEEKERQRKLAAERAERERHSASRKHGSTVSSEMRRLFSKPLR